MEELPNLDNLATLYKDIEPTSEQRQKADMLLYECLQFSKNTFKDKLRMRNMFIADEYQKLMEIITLIKCLREMDFSYYEQLLENEKYITSPDLIQDIKDYKEWRENNKKGE